MYRESHLKTVGVGIVLMLILVLASTPAGAQTAADIVGEWEFKMDMQGREMVSEAVFTLNPDGSLAGKWTSSGMGGRGGQQTESALTGVKFADGKLVFVRTIRFGDQEFSMNFEGALKDGKIVGNFVTQMGEMPAVGTRKAAPIDIVGEWEFTMQFGGRGGQRAQQQRAQPAPQRPATKIVFTKNPDGTYAGKWEGGMGGGQRAGQRGGQRAGMGAPAELSEVKLEGNKLTFVRKMQMQDRDFSMTFAGTVEGDTIKGNMTMAMMQQGQEMPVTMTRVKPLAALGDWEITMTFGEREMTSTLTISQNPDGSLAGKWVMGQRGESALSDVKFENGKLTFAQKRTMRGEETVSTFEGTIEGDILTGSMKTGDREIPIKGKRAGAPAPAAPPAPPVAAAAKVETAPAALVGAWELTSESQRGVRTNNLVINADMTGTYTQRDNPINIQDLKIEGDQVSFKIVQSRGGQETTREFKLKLQGTTLTGEYTTGRGTTKITGKKIK